MGKKNKKKNKLSFDESDFDAPMTYDDGDDYGDYGGGNSKKKNKRGNSSRYDDIYGGGDDYDDYGSNDYADYGDEYEDYEEEDYEEEELEEEEGDEDDEVEERYDPNNDPYKNWGKPDSERTPTVAASSTKPAAPKANDGFVNSNVFQETSAASSSSSSAPSPSWGLKPNPVVATPATPTPSAPKPVVATPTTPAPSALKPTVATSETKPSVGGTSSFSSSTNEEKKDGERTKENAAASTVEKSASSVQEQNAQNDCDEDEDWDAGPPLSERLKPIFAFCAAPLRLFKKREKTEEEIFEEELAREEAEKKAKEREKRAKEYAELKRLAEEENEEVDFTDYQEFVDAENKKSLLRFLSPVLYWKLFLSAGKAVTSLAFAPLLLLKKKKGEDEEDWEDADADATAAKSSAVEDESGDESDEEGDEFEGRNWMRVVKKTIGVAIVASLLLTIGYVGLLFLSGKHVEKTSELPSAVAATEKGKSDAKTSNAASKGEKATQEKAEKSGGLLARVRSWFGGDSKEKKATAKRQDVKTGEKGAKSLLATSDDKTTKISGLSKGETTNVAIGLKPQDAEAKSAAALAANATKSALEANDALGNQDEPELVDPLADDSAEGSDPLANATDLTEGSDPLANATDLAEDSDPLANATDLAEDSDPIANATDSAEGSDPLAEDLAEGADPALADDATSAGTLADDPTLAETTDLASTTNDATTTAMKPSTDLPALDVPTATSEAPETGVGDVAATPEAAPPVTASSPLKGVAATFDDGATSEPATFASSATTGASDEYALPASDALTLGGADWNDSALEVGLGGATASNDPATSTLNDWESGAATVQATALPTNLGAETELGGLGSELGTLGSDSTLGLDAAGSDSTLGLGALGADLNAGLESAANGLNAFNARVEQGARELQAGAQNIADGVNARVAEGAAQLQDWSNQASQGIENVVGGLTSSLDDASTGLRGTYDDLTTTATNAYRQTADSLRNVGETAREGWNNLQNAASNALTGLGGSPASTPSLAGAGSSLGGSVASTPSLTDAGSSLGGSPASTSNLTPSTTNELDLALDSASNANDWPIAAASISKSAVAAANATSGAGTPTASTANASPSVGGAPALTSTSTSSAGAVAQTPGDLPLPLPQASYVTTPLGRYGGSHRLDVAAFATRTTEASGTAPVAANLKALSPPVAATSKAVSAPVAAASDAVSTPVAAASESVGYRVYVTKEGDNLLTIAENELGASSRWGEIKRLNNFRSGATSFDVGTAIKLPLDN